MLSVRRYVVDEDVLLIYEDNVLSGHHVYTVVNLIFCVLRKAILKYR